MNEGHQPGKELTDETTPGQETKSKLREFKQRTIKQQNKEDKKWQKELAMLEQRTTQTVTLPLDKQGNTIEILKSLPEDLDELFGDFRKRWWELSQTDPDPENLEAFNQKKTEITEELYEWLAVICANPLLNADYFRNNRGRYCAEDVLMIIFSYLAGSAQRVAERIEEVNIRKRMRKFRKRPKDEVVH